jgi:transcriptional regulator of acetoin/glycerol metabolism
MHGATTAQAGDPLQYVLDRVENRGRRPGEVSDAIQLSWQRSAEAGLIPDKVHAPYDPGIDAEGRLRWAAAPSMTAVSVDMHDLRASLLLTDSRGQVLARWTGSSKAADLMDDIGGSPGFVCSEKAVGTNSIGLALITRGPSLVRGFEHFADRLTGFAGISRAVIHPATGTLLGVVNLCCPQREYNPAMRALVGRIVFETGQRLLADTTPGSAALREAFLRARRHSKGPVAALDAHTLLVNAAAGRLLGTEVDQVALWEWAQRAMGGTAQLDEVAGTFTLPSQSARCEPVHDGEFLAGAIIFFDHTRPPPVASTDTTRDESSWTTLTESERTIAEYVARGLTNRETGTLLYISPHTVDYHLRQIFRKLSVRSRVELARIVASMGH